MDPNLQFWSDVEAIYLWVCGRSGENFCGMFVKSMVLGFSRRMLIVILDRYNPTS